MTKDSDLNPSARAMALVESMDKREITAFSLCTRTVLPAVSAATANYPTATKLRVIEALGWSLLAAALEPEDARESWQKFGTGPTH